MIAWHVELENISTRMLSSQHEIGKTLVSWPQIGGAALMNGAAIAHAVKAISCGEKISGRALFSFENFFPIDILIKNEPIQHEGKISTMQSAADPLSKIIHAALLAPSGDNIQPWKIRRSNEGFTVTLDTAKDSSLYNTGNRAGFTALGAMIENAVITAQSLNVSLECNEDFIEGIITCTLGSAASDQTLALLAQEIPNRVTNRNQFEKRILSPDVKELLRQQNVLSSPLPGVEFKIIDAPCPQLTSAVSKNEKLLFENEKMHHEFFDTLRWEPAPWGLPISTLALPLPGLLVFKLARNWDRFKKYNALLNFSDVIPKQTATLYNHAGAYIVILGERSDNESFYHGGRLLERLWLASTAQGLSIQPMTGIIFLHHALSIDSRLALSKTEQNIVENSYDAIQNAAETKKHILFALRIGYCSKPGIHSPLTRTSLC